MTQQEIMFHKTAGLSFNNRNPLKLFLIQSAKSEGKEIQSLLYVFSTKREIININKQFLNHDYPTDIITFDLSKTNQKTIDAEIYICAEVVKKNAKEYGTTWTSELHRVIFHGLLHLCGYNDKTLAQQKKMREKENEWLKKYFVSRGTQKL